MRQGVSSGGGSAKVRKCESAKANRLAVALEKQGDRSGLRAGRMNSLQQPHELRLRGLDGVGWGEGHARGGCCSTSPRFFGGRCEPKRAEGALAAREAVGGNASPLSRAVCGRGAGGEGFARSAT